jgi:MFS family permease
MLLVGPLGDRFGRRPVFIWATAAFLAGSVLGGLAPTLPALVMARVVQGLGGGGLLVLIQAIVQLAAGQTPVQAGLTMLSLVGGLGLATVAAAQRLRRTGRAYGLPVIGALLVALALGLCTTLTPGSPLPVIMIYLFLLGAGTGLAWEVLVVVVQEAVPPDQLGSATAANGFCREVGVLVGTAAVGGLLVQRLAGTGVDPVAYADALIPLLGGLVPVALLAAGLLSAVRPVRLRAGLR